ncbi:AIPR family protein [Enterobacter sp. Tr-810]|uniref:AIPR family protein n=1 Tax=Enterobacter sp. Tr-810 TaxID=2608347 RepID=UPI001419CF25|nr:AIPR family protein [Enterobacter sp. Tr-810]NIF38537.1 AIPR family protein [Enterobacter sp. Tr-810]
MLDPILKHHINKFKSSFELNSNGRNPQETKVLESQCFERFVNYVMFSIDDPEIFTGDIDLLEFISVGGGNDTGIDGIGIRINEKVVRSIDEVKEIAKNSRKLNIDFIFTQSKLSSGFNLGEFSKFSLGIKNFFSENYLPENQHLKEIKKIKNFIYSDDQIISKLDNTPSIYIYYITTGDAKNIDENYLGAKKSLEDDINNLGMYFGNVLIESINGKQLIKYCNELENKFEVYLTVQDIIPLIVNMDNKDDIKKSYAFTCKAPEFLKILTKEDGQLRRSLFNSNVRDYLGNKGSVNSEIESTIKKEPEMFLLCNNGITIVCTEFEQVRDKLVKIENPQIVNGCQTSNSIFHLRDQNNIDRIQLIVRLISTENLNIANNIVRGTNKQNQVLDEAFEATLPFHQDVLEPFFNTYEGDTKLYYERRAKQYNNVSNVKKTQVVNLRILIHTFTSTFLSKPHESHLHEAKLLEEYGGNASKRKIFKEKHDPTIYYCCALIWYMFEKGTRDNKIPSKLRTYKHHLYYIFSKLCGPSPSNLDKSKNVTKYCNNLLNGLTNKNFPALLEKTIEIFDYSQKKWEEFGKSAYGIKDNKEFTDLVSNIIVELTQVREEKVDEEYKNEDKYEGKIVNIIKRKDHWFGFIKLEEFQDNIYFDNRGTDYSLTSLSPGVNIICEVEKGVSKPYATNITMIE